jgi:uncharacterized protein (UPF0332 family)
MNLEECFSRSLLSRISPDKEKSRRSMETAQHKLALSKKELGAGIYEGAIISAYASMFHSARALLFRDGVKERSHYAVYVYLREKYSGSMGEAALNEFSALRMQRHEVLYGFFGDAGAISLADAQQVISAAESFLSAAKKLLA